MSEYGFYCCDNDVLSTVDYTHCSMIDHPKTLIDNSLTSDNVSNMLQAYTSIDLVNNPPDYIAVQCVLDVSIHYIAEKTEPESLTHLSCIHIVHTYRAYISCHREYVHI